MPILERLFAIGPIRKAIWQLWYPFLTKRLREENVLFLNYAFETDPPEGLKLDRSDEPNRGCIQLYHHLASKVNLEGKTVLEVSCGHGGGASWITRAMQPESYTGLDLNPTGIEFCQEHHQDIENLTFIQGDAQALPFADASLDVVINLEASHCYPNFAGFLSEVARVLRPGGHFVYADFRFSDQFSDWEQAIETCEMEIIEHQNVSPEVLRGMDGNAERSLELVLQRLPRVLHASGRDFAGVPGSRVYDALASGELSYRSWVFQAT